MKRVTYILTEDHTFIVGPHDAKTVPKGSFVVPMDARWVPKHIKDGAPGRWMDDKKEVFVYTKYGIIVVPKKIIGEAY